MKNNKNLIIITIISIALIAIIVAFIAITNKKKNPNNDKTVPVAEVETELILSESEKPIISLIPRADGYELKLIIDNIPANISEIEYELIYSAIDDGLEMEKGVGDTIKVTSNKIERDLLLGTSSCTNGCKYKYDKGVVGGTLSLTFLTATNQYLRYESTFVLKTSADIKKDGGLSLTLEDFEITATTTSKSDYFVLIKNLPSYYSVFSNGNGKGTITNITPANISKEDKTNLTGNYLIN